MDQHQVNLKIAVSWSFEFENQEWFAGFRDLATNGVDKPVLNMFRMFGMMNGDRVAVTTADGMNAADIIASGVTGKPDSNALASKNDHAISVLVWNYHDGDVAAAASPVELIINGIAKNKALVHHYRVDQQYSNSFEKWKIMGKPQHVSKEQYQELEKAGQLQWLTSPEWKEVTNGNTVLNFHLPRQGVSLIQLSW